MQHVQARLASCCANAIADIAHGPRGQIEQQICSCMILANKDGGAVMPCCRAHTELDRAAGHAVTGQED